MNMDMAMLMSKFVFYTDTQIVKCRVNDLVALLPIEKALLEEHAYEIQSLF